MCGGLASIAVLGSFVDAAPQRNEDFVPHWSPFLLHWVCELATAGCQKRNPERQDTASRSSRFWTISMCFPGASVLVSGPQTMPRHYSFGASLNSVSRQALRHYGFWFEAFCYAFLVYVAQVGIPDAGNIWKYMMICLQPKNIKKWYQAFCKLLVVGSV